MNPQTKPLEDQQLVSYPMDDVENLQLNFDQDEGFDVNSRESLPVRGDGNLL